MCFSPQLLHSHRVYLLIVPIVLEYNNPRIENTKNEFRFNPSTYSQWLTIFDLIETFGIIIDTDNFEHRSNHTDIFSEERKYPSILLCTPDENGSNGNID